MNDEFVLNKDWLKGLNGRRPAGRPITPNNLIEMNSIQAQQHKQLNNQSIHPSIKAKTFALLIVELELICWLLFVYFTFIPEATVSLFACNLRKSGDLFFLIRSIHEFMYLFFWFLIIFN